eukprot:TRINITY_DN5600_c0_g1_i2.p1 TRINITY_DN5600_c0_g1~~TRINITY_DN5600_c0_g1_i2.p1  ORF type:complete len:206 (-),score=0.28 TRINITY_DN5600_c0_g1_i2:183-800(-)
MGFVPEDESSSTAPLTDASSSSSHGSQAAASHSTDYPANYPTGYPAAPAYGARVYPPTHGPTTVVMVHGPLGDEFPIFSPVPMSGVYMLPPREQPQPDQVIIGYESCSPPSGCFSCSTLSPLGWVLSAIGFMICWPAALLPCLFPQLHSRCQRPVFGYPATGPVPSGHAVFSNALQASPILQAQAPPTASPILQAERAPTKVVVV